MRFKLLYAGISFLKPLYYLRFGLSDLEKKIK